MATTDPVKSKSAFLCMYMSNHPDTLAAYVMHELYLHDKPYEGIRNVKMESIDSASLRLTYAVEGNSRRTEIIIPFDPPLQSYDEVRPRLTAMKADAEEHLGMVKYPVLDKFALPDPLLSAIIVPLIVLLFYVSLPGNIHPLASVVRSYSGEWRGVAAAWAFFLTAHSIEGFYANVLAKRVKMSENNTLLWTIQTAIFGIPSLIVLRRMIATARIKSVQKQK